MRIILTFLAFLLLPHTVFALDLVYPTPGQANVEVDSCFQWGKVPEAEKYVLDISPFDESIDNISPSRCYNNFSPVPADPKCPSGENVCIFPFLDLPPGRNIQYTDSYTWSVTAFDSVGNPIGGSSGSRTFTTEQEPQSVGPPPGGGGTAPIINPGDLNPISAKNLTELFNKIFSFLFGLAIFIVPVVVIYAAFLMLMGGGDPVKLAKGRMILMWTAIAFILILLSRGLPVVFKNLL